MRKRPRMQRDFVMGCRPGDGTDGEHAIALANREKSGVKSSRWNLEDQRNARELESARFRVFVALEGGDEDEAMRLRETHGRLPAKVRSKLKADVLDVV